MKAGGREEKEKGEGKGVRNLLEKEKVSGTFYKRFLTRMALELL
jgi:hypothetical protein